jgi:uncharacterized protein (TIGR03083 family)
MVDTRDIAGLDAFALMEQEADRCARFFETAADEAVWARDTRCEGWDVRDLLSHLAGVETYHLACLDDDLPHLFEEGAKAGVTDVHGFNAWLVKLGAERSRDEVLDEWRTKNAEVRRRMRELGPGGTMSSSVGPYPVDLMAFHIASEYATHADDMDVPVDDSEAAARSAWRANVSRFALKETEKPVQVDQRGNTYVVTTGGKSATLTEHDFVEAVTARATSVELDPELRSALVALA